MVFRKRDFQFPLIAIIFYFSYDLVKSIIAYVTGRSDLAEILCAGFLTILFIASIISSFNKIKIPTIFVILFCLLSILITSIMHPEYRNSMFGINNVFKQVFGIHKGVALLVLLTLLDDPEELLVSLKIGAFCCFVDKAIKSLIGSGYLSENYNSNHEFGYIFMFVSVVYFISFVKNKKRASRIFDLVLFIVSAIFMILVGARTTILAFLIFFALYYLFFNYKKIVFSKRLLILGITIGVFALFALTSLKDIISFILRPFGVSSKIIDAFLSGDNRLDGGRLFMYETNQTLLASNPWGLGIYWDRYTYPLFTYTHNFIYEILIGFGWLLGGLILFGLVFGSLKMLTRKDDGWKSIGLIFLSLWVVRLVLSYSFWLDFSFWATIAIIINSNYRLNKSKIKERSTTLRIRMF